MTYLNKIRKIVAPTNAFGFAGCTLLGVSLDVFFSFYLFFFLFVTRVPKKLFKQNSYPPSIPFVFLTTVLHDCNQGENLYANQRLLHKREHPADSSCINYYNQTSFSILTHLTPLITSVTMFGSKICRVALDNRIHKICHVALNIYRTF